MYTEGYGNIERPFKGGFKDLGCEPQWTIGVSQHLPAEGEHGVGTGYAENGSAHSGWERALQRELNEPDQEEPLDHGND